MPYDYFTRLGQAFINGKYYLEENPPWLNEMVPAGQNRFYVVYPPMPAILSIPFLLIFGNGFKQEYLAHALGATISVLTSALAYKLKKDKALALWTGLAAGLGSIIWFLSSTGWVWFTGQLTGAFFLTLALYESYTKKRPLITGFALGAAYLSRAHLILALPFFLYLLRHKLKKTEKLITFLIPLTILIGFDFFYNLIRFGSILNKGYFLIPGILNEPWYSKGILHVSYIPNHIKIMLFALPNLLKDPPFITPSWSGLAIWITSPFFLFITKSQIKKTNIKLTLLGALAIALVIFIHGGTGFAQFGYRYALDFYPFLFLLTINALSQNKFNKTKWIFLIVAVIVNLWGVLWINKFGWISY